MSSTPTSDDVRAHIRVEMDHAWAASDDHEFHGPDPEAVREVERAERFLSEAVAAAPDAFEAIAIEDTDARVRARALGWLLRAGAARDALLTRLATDPAPEVAASAQEALAPRLARFDELAAIFAGAAPGARTSIARAMVRRDTARAVEVILARAGADPEHPLARLLARALTASGDERAQGPLLELALAGHAPVSDLDDEHARALLDRAPPARLLRKMAKDAHFARWPELQRALLARAGEDDADVALIDIAPALRTVALPPGLALRSELVHDEAAGLSTLAREEPAQWIADALVAHLRTVEIFSNAALRRHFLALAPGLSRLPATTLIAALEAQRFPSGFEHPRIRYALDLLIRLGPEVNAWLDAAVVGSARRHLSNARQYR